MAQVSQHHKKTRMIAVAALVAGVLGLGVAFAALSTTLLINGTAKIASSSWDVRWKSLNCTPSHEAQVKTADTKIVTTTDDDDTVNISVEFKAKDDQVVCTMVAGNDGSIDAKLSGYAASIANLSSINVTAVLQVGGATPADNRPLAASTTDTYTLTLTYTGDPLGSASESKTFTYTLPYVQAN
jgi:hypothetical protein